MFWSNLKIFWRNLWKNGTFTTITLVGLSLSMSVCMLFIMLIRGAYDFDTFHPRSESVYRILTTAERKAGGTESYATSPTIVGEQATNNYAFVEEWVPLNRGLSGEVVIEEAPLSLRGLFTKPAFFELFGFTLEKGDPATALSEPYSLVLTQETSARFFGKEDPLGKTLEMPGLEATFTVTGLLDAFPGKTHLEFEALGAYSTLQSLETAGQARSVRTDWTDYYSTYNFVQLKEGVAPAELENALAEVAATGYAGLQLETRDAGYSFSLQPLAKITPGGNLSNSMGRGLPSFLLIFLSVLGLIVILSASFNYTSLSIARSLSRTKEVGVRKVLGANRRQVFWQFIFEAVAMALVALLLAYPLLKVAIQGFNQLQFAEFTDMNLMEDTGLYGWFVLFAVLVGMLAGALPALTLSKTSPQVVLQQLSQVRLLGKMSLRRALLAIQLCISLAFLVMVTATYRQVGHALAMNFGFDKEYVLNVDMQGQDYTKLANTFAAVSGVEEISAISHSMGTWADSKADVRVEEQAEPVEVRDYIMDEAYLDNFGLQLVAGENFPRAPEQQQERFAIVNETFLRQFQLGAPTEALGKTIFLGDSTRLALHGVVEDFHYKPAVYKLEPLLLRYSPEQLNVMNLKLNNQDAAGTIAALERAWKKMDPHHPFEYQFFDEAVRENYSNFMDLLWIVGFLALLAIVIALMGLFGMAVYTIKTRKKEISIRKVMGASLRDLAWLLSKSYFYLFLIAAAIALPISYLLSKQLVLQQFAHQYPMGVGLFLPGLLMLAALVALTVLSQAWKAARTNPAEALKVE